MRLFFTLFFLIFSIFSQKASAIKLREISTAFKTEGRFFKDGSQNIYLNNNEVFITNRWGAVVAFDISNPLDPKMTHKIITEGTVRYLDFYQNFIYLADEINGISIYERVNNQYTFVKNVRLQGEATWVRCNENKLYVALGRSGIEVFDLSDPKVPTTVGKIENIGWTWYLDIKNDHLFLADSKSGLKIYNKHSLEQHAQIDVSKGHLRAVAIDGDRAFMVLGAAGVEVMDIRDITNIKSLGKVTINLDKKDSYIYSVSSIDNFLYLSDEQNHIVLVDLSKVGSPKIIYTEEMDEKCYGIAHKGVYSYLVSNTKLTLFRHNYAPEMEELKNQHIKENERLSLPILGSDKDGDPFTYEATNLPEGASFSNGVLDWVPNYEQSGNHKNIAIRMTENTPHKLFAEQTIQIKVDHVNRTPFIAQIESHKIKEDQELIFKIPFGTDLDKEDKGLLRHYFTALPKGASFFEDSMSFRWTPDYDQSGRYDIVYGVIDPIEARDEKTFKIDVEHVDRPPVLQPISEQYVNENQSLEIFLQGSDPDEEDQQRLRYFAQYLPEGAVFSDRTLKWKPTFDQSGEYTIKFTLRSGDKSSVQECKINVKHVNRAPSFHVVKAMKVEENKSLSFFLSVSDPDKEDIGKLNVKSAILPDGSSFDETALKFSWKPTFDQSGDYTPQFTVHDPTGLSHSITVPIEVAHVNRMPMIAVIPQQDLLENVPFNYGLQVTDPDREDTNILVMTAKNLPVGSRFDEKSRTIFWTPNYDQSGVYPQISFTVSDGRLTSSQKMKLVVKHVNRSPSISIEPTYSVQENKLLFFKLTVDDPDKEDLNKLKIVSSVLPHGADFTSSTRQFKWTPGFSQSGDYKKITFTVTDTENAKASASTDIHVENVNRSPLLTINKSFVLKENQTFSMKLNGTDADKEDIGKLKYSVEGPPLGSTLIGDGFSWQPTFDQAGTYTSTFVVTDLSGSADRRLVTFIVNDVNRPPVFENVQEQHLRENEPFKLPIVATDPDKEDVGQLNIQVSGLPKGATFVHNEIHWIPTYNQSGTYPLSLTVTDRGNRTAKLAFSLNVEHVNRPPVLETVQNSTQKENARVSVSFNASDLDLEDKNKLTFKINRLPEGAVFEGQTLNWTPSFEQAGDYELIVSVKDLGGLTDQKTFKLTIENVNRLPVFSEIEVPKAKENEQFRLVLNATDADQEDSLTYHLASIPEGALLNGNRLTWTPDFDQAGAYNLDFSVTDGKSTVNKSIVLHVENTNRPPKLNPVNATSVHEGEATIIEFSAIDADKEDTSFRFSISTLPNGASLKNNQFKWTPSYEQSGNYSFLVTAKDAGGLESKTSFSIEVRNVNRKPELIGVKNQKLKIGKHIRIDFDAKDPDEDDVLDFKLIPLPANAILRGNRFEWTPDSTQIGSHQIKVIVTDGKLNDEKAIELRVE